MPEGRPHEADEQEDEEEGAQEAEEPEAEAVTPAIAPAADVRPDGIAPGRHDDLAALSEPLAQPRVVCTDTEEGDAGEDHQGQHDSGDTSSVHIDHFSELVAVIATA
jgi:hypothetical protein